MILFLPHLVNAEQELTFKTQQGLVNAAVVPPAIEQVVKGSVVILGSTIMEGFFVYLALDYLPF
jgi:hypothetical protein